MMVQDHPESGQKNGPIVTDRAMEVLGEDA